MSPEWAVRYKKLVERNLTGEELARVWDQSLELGITWSWPGERDYPKGWMNLNESDGPPLFCYKGLPVWMKFPSISIVGSRTPMRDTCLWMQREVGRFLDDNPVAVVSGGARGVDQWAHRICMDSGRPTVCVFPSGLTQIYPPGSDQFFQRILDTGGAWVSTFPLDAGMRKRMFLTRNRWITGFSPVTFVVEANRRSGSSLTASLALRERREVCTLPVFPYSNQGLGNLDLIAQLNASVVRDHQDLAGIFKINKHKF